MTITRPLESLVENLLGPMSFFEEKNCGNKIREISIVVEKTYLVGGEFYIKSYVGNTYPQIIVFRWWDIKIYVICLPHRNDSWQLHEGHDGEIDGLGSKIGPTPPPGYQMKAPIKGFRLV